MDERSEYKKIEKYLKFYHISDLINWRDSMIKKKLENTELFKLINGEIEYRNSDKNVNNLIEKKFFAFLDSLIIQYEDNIDFVYIVIDTLPDLWNDYSKKINIHRNDLISFGYNMNEKEEEIKEKVMLYLDFLAKEYDVELVNRLVKIAPDNWRLHEGKKQYR